VGLYPQRFTRVQPSLLNTHMFITMTNIRSFSYWLGISLIVVGQLGCYTSSSFFHRPTDGQAKWALEKFGEGQYYIFSARPQDMFKQEGDKFSRIQILLNAHMKTQRVCPAEYTVLEKTLDTFEGGTTQIYVRCES
jgi:hypothetical protein